MEPRIFLSDLDDTLIKSSIEADKKLAESVKREMRDIAIENGLPAEEIESCENRVSHILNTVYKIIRRDEFKSKAKEIRKAVEKPLLLYDREQHKNCVEMPGATEAFRVIHEDYGYRIGIVSTTDEKGIEDVLNRFGFGKYVERFRGRDRTDYVKPNPEHIIAILRDFNANSYEYFLGNSDNDGIAANLSGGKFIFLDNGDIGFNRMRYVKIDYAVRNLSEIPLIIKRF